MPLISFIPERFHDGFEALESMNDDEFSALKEGLALTSLVSSIEVLAQKVAEIKKLDTDEIEEIFSSVGSLVPYIADEEMVEEIVADISRIGVENAIIEEENKDKFEERLRLLIDNKQIYYASKAFDLRTQYGNIYLQSRIVSDIRPVFDIKLNDGPKAGIIVHNLSIHYQSADEPMHKDIILSLSAQDLKSLMAVISRAEEKEKRLQSVFENSGMTDLNE